MSHTDNIGTTSKYFDSAKQFNSKTLNDSDDFLPKPVKKKTESAATKKSVKTRKKRTTKNNQDIRSANNLIQFTKDFKKVCNKGGVDVDPDQLQLAIALSQSLQDGQNSHSVPDEAIDEDKPCNTQQKITNIRKTLEQFGFTVNSSETLENNFRKRNKRSKRWYPLINKTYEEKQQIIANKVSHILLENLHFVSSPSVDKQTYNCESELLKKSFCEKACWVSKCFPKREDFLEYSIKYHIPDLFEPSSSKIGCLLKDWSKIPGRDKSPERDNISTDFKNNILFQNHFDVLLSGTIDKIITTMESLTSKSDPLEEPVFDCDNTIEDVEVTCYSPDLFGDSMYNDKTDDSIKHNAASSDDELPYVFMNHNAIRKNLLRREAHQSNCSDVIFIDDEIKSSLCLDKSENKTECNTTHLSINENEKTLSDESAIIHYEVYQETCAKNESPQSVQSEFSEGKNRESKSPSCSKNCELKSPPFSKCPSCSKSIDFNKDVSVVEEIDLTQSDDEGSFSANLHKDSNLVVQTNVSENSENDVFILSDDELNYSVSVQPKLIKCKTEYEDSFEVNNSQNEGSIKTDDIESKSILKENYGPSTSTYNHCSIDISNTENPIDISSTIQEKQLSKWYRSSIFDSIASESINLRNTLVNDENCPIVNDQSMNLRNTIINDKKCPIVDENFKRKTIFNDDNLSMHDSFNIVETFQNTPKSKFVIKTNNITPMNDYNSMDSPKLVEELSKYGLKPLKRKRAVQILEHIYNQIHPLVDTETLENKIKRRKIVLESPKKPVENLDNIENHGNFNKVEDCVAPENETDTYKKTSHHIVIEELNCDSEDWILPSKGKSKVQGPAVPLHVVFHNYLSTRSLLKEAILKYEPVDIEKIHHDIKEIGFKYKPTDLMDFLDKKCITIKTAVKKKPIKS